MAKAGNVSCAFHLFLAGGVLQGCLELSGSLWKTLGNGMGGQRVLSEGQLVFFFSLPYKYCCTDCFLLSLAGSYCRERVFCPINIGRDRHDDHPAVSKGPKYTATISCLCALFSDIFIFVDEWNECFGFDQKKWRCKRLD
ncbi:hypothetical protein F5Y17DRAFT_442797 [Xylariaceae sp. FL0594]|nr:hypothetical protein F5Y17DRAFT_442797 [Xylariaceae sp. FL0594]